MVEGRSFLARKIFGAMRFEQFKANPALREIAITPGIEVLLAAVPQRHDSPTPVP